MTGIPNIRLVRQLGFNTYATLLQIRDDVATAIRAALSSRKEVASLHMKKGSFEYRGDYLKAARIIVEELCDLGYRATLYNNERIDMFWEAKDAPAD